MTAQTTFKPGDRVRWTTDATRSQGTVIDLPPGIPPAPGKNPIYVHWDDSILPGSVCAHHTKNPRRIPSRTPPGPPKQ